MKIIFKATMAIYELKNEEIKIKEIQERKECIL